MSDSSPVTPPHVGASQSPDALLMQSIRQKWGPAITAACHLSSVPEEFLGALVANETGGDPTKTRFEEKVFGEICAVCSGKRARYGSLGAGALLPPPGIVPSGFKPGLDWLVDLSTSWGLTQIMGYQVLMFGRKLTSLTDPRENLSFATVLLAQFANRHHLDMRNEFTELFACWNTGGPDPTKTYDPNYCANGVARMVLYGQAVGT